MLLQVDDPHFHSIKFFLETLSIHLLSDVVSIIKPKLLVRSVGNCEQDWQQETSSSGRRGLLATAAVLCATLKVICRNPHQTAYF